MFKDNKYTNLQVLVYGITRKGHYENYCIFFEKAFQAKTVYSLKRQLKEIFTNKILIFIDGDRLHLLFFPLVLIRNFMNKRSVFLNIRSEKILQKTKVYAIKRILHKWMRRLSNIKIVSIHKFSRNRMMDNYFDEYIYDIQYWDLPWLKIKIEIPPELTGFKSDKPVLLVAGQFNDKRCKLDLLNELKNSDELNYSIVFSCKMNKEEYALCSKHKDCLVINRYITDEELIYLYEFADIIYCYYDSNYSQRPSGLFGRAVQLGKHALVKKYGYLHKYHREYKGIIDVSSLSEFNELVKELQPQKKQPVIYDDYKSVARILWGKR